MKLKHHIIYDGIASLCLFHTAEVIGSIYLASLLLNSNIVKAIFWGMVFHMVLDILFLLKMGALFCRAFSFLEYVIRKRIMIKNGLSPDAIFEEALVLAGVHVTRIQQKVTAQAKKDGEDLFARKEMTENAK